MKTFVSILVCSAALGLLAVPATAAPRHERYHPGPQGAGAAYAVQPQIACTVTGCLPVPSGCHPEIGYTPGGTPTGFDVMVCGNYTLYGYRQ